MSFKDEFNQAFKTYLEREKGLSDVSEVSYFSEDTYWTGGCETCSWEETVVEISYITTNGDRATYTVYSSLSDLINRLLAGWPE